MIGLITNFRTRYYNVNILYIIYSTLKALFTIANPLRILANLLRIFLMRPLGKKNLLQRFLEVTTSLLLI